MGLQSARGQEELAFTPNFGSISSAQDSRQLQFAAQVRFLNVIATRGPRSIFPVISFAIPGAARVDSLDFRVH